MHYLKGRQPMVDNMYEKFDLALQLIKDEVPEHPLYKHTIATPLGSAKAIAEQLRQEQEEYGLNEAMICSIPHSQEKRLNVYKLLAKELL